MKPSTEKLWFDKGHQRGYAKENRKHPTQTEKLLWHQLRCKRMCGVRFHRQSSLLNYIVDFYCPKAKLVIEVDGPYHAAKEQRSIDGRHDRCLGTRGLLTLRFTNEQVLYSMGNVLAAIRETVTHRCATKPIGIAGKSSAERKLGT